MKKVLSLVPAILLCTLANPVSAQIVLTADLGNVTLESGMAGQVRNLTIRKYRRPFPG